MKKQVDERKELRLCLLDCFFINAVVFDVEETHVGTRATQSLGDFFPTFVAMGQSSEVDDGDFFLGSIPRLGAEHIAIDRAISG